MRWNGFIQVAVFDDIPKPNHAIDVTTGQNIPARRKIQRLHWPRAALKAGVNLGSFVYGPSGYEAFRIGAYQTLLLGSIAKAETTLSCPCQDFATGLD